MATNKNQTVETTASVAAFVKSIKDEKKRNDFSAIMELFSKTTKLEPKMWGSAIVGFGSYHYKYDSGREGDAPLAGMASRVSGITLYLGTGFDKSEELFAKLGKYKLSGGCVHVKKLEDIDTAVLVKMIKNSVAYRKKEHSCS